MGAEAELIKAVERYIGAEKYPSIEVICAILNIKMSKDKEEENELAHRYLERAD